MSRLQRGLLIAFVVCLVVSAVAFAGLRLWRRAPAPDPLADFRPGLRPDFTIPLSTIDALHQYSITVRLDPTAQAYTGTVQVTYPVSATTPLTDVYLRLYPNLPKFDGTLLVTTAQVNGMSVSYGYSQGATALHLTWGTPLPVGKRATVKLGFNGTFKEHRDNYYTLLGKSEQILSFASFYPVLATRRSDGWALDVANPQGDFGFEEAALFRSTLTLPNGLVVAGTGVQVSDTPAEPGWHTLGYVAGPARELIYLVSSQYQVLEAEAYGTKVRSFFLPSNPEAGKSALYDAVAALEIYSDRYGPYPYREMSVVEAPLTYHGQEYPGVNLIGKATYDQYQQDLETLVAHEVAHQWWYNQVGSDQIRNPWQDEGLAEYALYDYFEARHGLPAAQWLRETRWQVPVKYAGERGFDAPINRPVDAYEGNYETMVYAKGALFFAELRDQMGDDNFRAFLRAYLAEFRWRIAQPSDLLHIAERISNQDLTPLAKKYLDGQ
jgi:hypothetical protein